MSAEQRPNIITRTVARGVDVTAGFSKAVDKVTLVGAGVAVLAGEVLKIAAVTNIAFGVALVSILTMIPANELQKWAKKKN